MRCFDVLVWRSGALEARRDVEVWGSSVLFVVVEMSSFRSSRPLRQNASGAESTRRLKLAG